jgi:hypothetical protein
MDDAKNRLHQASMQQNACVFRLKIYRGRRCCSTAASISHQGGRQIRERETIEWMDEHGSFAAPAGRGIASHLWINQLRWVLQLGLSRWPTEHTYIRMLCVPAWRRYIYPDGRPSSGPIPIRSKESTSNMRSRSAANGRFDALCYACMCATKLQQ